MHLSNSDSSVERSMIQKLRIRSISQLSKSNDTELANWMLWSHMREYHPLEPRHDYYHDLSAAFKLLPQLAPNWWYRSIKLVGEHHRVVIECKREVYECKFVATHINNPMVISAITARMLDLNHELGIKELD